MKKILFLILALWVSLGLINCQAFYGPAGEGQRQSKPGSGGTSVTVTALAPNDATLSGSLALWLDASYGVYASDCTTSAADSTPVGCWQDKSSNAIPLTGNGSTYPTYFNGGLNGKPAIHFDSNSSQFFQTSYPLDLSANAITIITVSNLGPAGASSTPIFYIGDSIKMGQYIATMSNDYGFEVSSQSFPFSGASIGNPVIFTTTASYNSDLYQTSGEMFWNGNGNGFVNPTGSPMSNLSGINIGYHNNMGSYLTGDIAEIIVYNRVLTAAEREGVEKYLRNKYNIPIAQ